MILTFEKFGNNKKDRCCVLASYHHMPHSLRSLPCQNKYSTDIGAGLAYINPEGNDLLDLFFNPLFALLILFLECEIFDLGTASTIGGNRSNKDARPGMDRYHAGVASEERRMGVDRDAGREDRRNDWIWGRKGRVDRDELAMRDRAVIVAVILCWSGC
jgi:hypothetical protein